MWGTITPRGGGQAPPSVVRIEIVRTGIDLSKPGSRADVAHGVHQCDAGIGRHQHLIALPHAKRKQGQVECARPGVRRDGPPPAGD